MKKTIALSAISAMALTGFAYSEIESSFNVGYNSTYVWRGQDLGDSMYQYGLDFGGSCDCGLDWSAGIWYANPSDAALNDELDIYGEISKDLGVGTVALGFIHYEFDENGADNTEAYVSLSTSYAGLELGATYYQVIDGNIGNPSWAELSASYGFEISDKLSASLGLGLGSTVDTDGGDSYVNYNASLSFDYAVSEDISFSPYIAYNSASGLDALTDFDGLYGGAVVTFSF
ncbi:MAG: hypothetical protein ACSHYB_15830 [Roseibacillus sp.]